MLPVTRRHTHTAPTCTLALVSNTQYQLHLKREKYEYLAYILSFVVKSLQLPGLVVAAAIVDVGRVVNVAWRGRHCSQGGLCS